MKTKLVLALVLLLSAVGCKADLEAIPDVSATNQASITPSPEPTATSTMPILRKISEFKASAPSSDPQQVADYANDLLPQLGYEYELDLERIIIQKIKQRKTKPVKVEGDDWPYVSFDLEVMTTTNSKKQISITAPADAVCCCGYYYTRIAVTKVSPKELTVVVDSKEVIIARPKEIPVVQEYIFGKEAPRPAKLRSWEVPSETYPYGVSSDGLKLYVETEIDELLLEISETGSLRFVPKGLERIVTEGEDLRKLPAPREGEILHKSGEFGLIRYVLNGTPYVLEFPYPCT
jgi:hypothetical protein